MTMVSLHIVVYLTCVSSCVPCQYTNCLIYHIVTLLLSDEVVTAASTTIAVLVPAYFSVALISPSVGTFWMRSSFPLFVMYVCCCDDSNAFLCYFLRYCACLDASLTRSASHTAADMTDVLIASSPSVEPQHASSFAIETTARSQNAEGKCTLTPPYLYFHVFITVLQYSSTSIMYTIIRGTEGFMADQRPSAQPEAVGSEGWARGL